MQSITCEIRNNKQNRTCIIDLDLFFKILSKKVQYQDKLNIFIFFYRKRNKEFSSFPISAKHDFYEFLCYIIVKNLQMLSYWCIREGIYIAIFVLLKLYFVNKHPFFCVKHLKICILFLISLKEGSIPEMFRIRICCKF